MGLPLASGELAWMRDTIEGVTLAGTAIILSPTKTRDTQGAEAWVYAASGTVACHFSPENQRSREAEQIIGDRLAEVTPYILTVPHTTTIDEDDRVTVNSITYEVSEVLDNRTWQLAKRVRCFEVD